MDVTSISAERAQEIADASIVEGHVNSAGNLVLTNGGGIESNAGSVTKPPQIDAFFVEDMLPYATWTKPAGAKMCYFYVIGGGGGGAGSYELTGNHDSGGGGGGGGFNDLWAHPDGIPSTVQVDVGAGGGGGLANGGPGSGDGEDGGQSKFAGLVAASGGNGALSLNPGEGTDFSSAGTPGNIFGGYGGQRMASFGTPDTPAEALKGGGGGGGGANQSSLDVPGGNGGNAGGGAIAMVTSAGTPAPQLLALIAGGGGRGGGTSTEAPNARPGETGGLYGGGGGGGACRSATPNVHAAGGAGAPGLAVVITFF